MRIGKDARGVGSLDRPAVDRIAGLDSECVLLADARQPGLPIIFANGAYTEQSGYSAAELTGNGWRLAARAAEGLPELAALKSALERQQPCQLDVDDVRKDGSTWSTQLRLEPLYDGDCELRYFLCVQKPVKVPMITEQSVETTQRDLVRPRIKTPNLERMDPATGLLRFDYFKELLARDLAVARRDQRAMTVLLFEIVEFDAYLRTFGPKAAESCQRMIGAQVTRTLRRASDLCARYDDSTIVASVLDQRPAEAEPLAEQIAANVRRLGLHNPRAKTERYVRVRTGVAACDPANDDPEAAIARARRALGEEREPIRAAKR
ncbi:MAG TPA: diguanylate cyclase [Gammaproteobacteria bacterium]